VARNAPVQRIALAAALAALVLIPSAFADKGGNGPKAGNTHDSGAGAASTSTASPSGKPGGGGSTGSSTCGTAPRASITNTWAWGASGAWGLPGQQVGYQVMVFNDDVNCGSSTFNVSVSAPQGFSVSIPQQSITLGSASTGNLWVYVTSPSDAADGDYPLTVTASRSGASSASTSFYKVYSSDTTGPKLYYANPANGDAVTGRSLNIGVASSDDHAVKRLELYLDGALKTSASCENNVAFECQISYTWAIRRVHGQHTATFKSYDWMGNVSTLISTFTVN